VFVGSYRRERITVVSSSMKEVGLSLKGRSRQREEGRGCQA
jgi:hypothetical protein